MTDAWNDDVLKVVLACALAIGLALFAGEVLWLTRPGRAIAAAGRKPKMKNTLKDAGTNAGRDIRKETM